MTKVFAKWGPHGGILREALKDMRRKETFLDCVIIADGGRVPVHKVVLAAFSPYFENFLKESTNSTSFVLAPGASYENMKLFVDFMYDGEIRLTQEEMGPLLAIASKFQIKGVEEVLVSAQNRCRQQMEERRRNRRRGQRQGVVATPAPVVDLTMKQSPQAVNSSMSYSVSHNQTEHSNMEDVASTEAIQDSSRTSAAVLETQPPMLLPVISSVATRGNMDLDTSSASSDVFNESPDSPPVLFSASSPDMLDEDSSNPDRRPFTPTSVAQLLEKTKTISAGVRNTYNYYNGCSSPSPETLARAYSVSPPPSSASRRSVSTGAVQGSSAQHRGRSKRRRGRSKTRRGRMTLSQGTTSAEQTCGDAEAHERQTICANFDEWSMFENSTISQNPEEPSSKKRRYSLFKRGQPHGHGQRTSHMCVPEDVMNDCAGPSSQ